MVAPTFKMMSFPRRGKIQNCLYGGGSKPPPYDGVISFSRRGVYFKFNIRRCLSHL